MAETFNYSGSISQRYVFKRYDSALSATTAIRFEELNFSKPLVCQVEAYAFSNVDAYGAQVLCWHNQLTDDITADVKASADALLSSDDKFGSAWNLISAYAIEDAEKIKSKGWISINTRYLSK